MRKASILFAFLLFACTLASTQDENFDKVHIKVTKVSGNVYMLEGEGGNIGASVGDDGIALIDDQYAPLAEKIQAALKGITDKPVRLIITPTTTWITQTEMRTFRNKRLSSTTTMCASVWRAEARAGNGSPVHLEAKPQPNTLVCRIRE